MRLFVGLGNPGARYEGTRHNVGFLAIDEINRKFGFQTPRSRFLGAWSDGRIGGERVMTLKPATYVNESGRAVGDAVRFFKLGVRDVIVIHDELDLAFGKIRCKDGGGNAGHNGLKSIDAHIGKEYRRVRIGIGHPGDKARVSGHVLKDFSGTERRQIDALIDIIANAAEDLLAPDANAFTNRIGPEIRALFSD